MTTTVVGELRWPLVRLRAALLGASAVAAAALGVWASRGVTLPITSDYGLAAALPPAYWVGLAGLNLVFVVAVAQRRPSGWLLGVVVGLMVLLLFGAPALADPVPRLEVSWRHLGIADQLATSGRVDPMIDGYFNWPGFFAGLAAIFQVGHVSPRALALLAPVVDALVWCLGVAAVVRSLTDNRRHLWVALWLFLVGNWIDQEYASPQAFGFALHLLVVALVLRYLAATPGLPLHRSIRAQGLVAGARSWWRSRTPREPDAGRRVAALLLAGFLGAVVIVSHQLTPFMLIATVLVLTVTGRLWTPALLAVLVVMALLWLGTGASAYVNGHQVVSTGVTQAAGANLQDRIAGSPGHLAVLKVRTALTCLLFLLAVLGWLRMPSERGRRRLFRRRPEAESLPGGEWAAGRWTVALLCGVPFALIPVQSYGGEMLMRSTLFALPFAAYLAAGLFVARGPAMSPRPAGALLVVASVCSGAVVTAHYGNASFDMFSPAEVQAVDRLYEVAPPGAVLVSVTHATPWKFTAYSAHRYVTLTDLCPRPLRAGPCYRRLDAKAGAAPAGTLLIVTAAQQRSLVTRGDAAPGVLPRIERLLLGGGDARRIYVNPDAAIYRIGPAGQVAP